MFAEGKDSEEIRVGAHFRILGRTMADDAKLNRAFDVGREGSELINRGDARGALAKFEESLGMRRQVHGDRPHPDIAWSLHSIGMVLMQQGDLAGARSKFQAMLKMYQQLPGDNHAETQRARAAVERLETTAAPGEAGSRSK